jgi:uncharacterized protein YjdB
MILTPFMYMKKREIIFTQEKLTRRGIYKFYMPIIFLYFLSIFTGFAQTFPTSRDPFLWPFTQTSIWNMPIGSAAVYEPAGLLPVTDFPNQAPYWRGGIAVDDEPIIIASATDPIVSVYNTTDWSYRCNTTSNTGKQIHFPANQTFASPDGGGGTPNYSGATVQPNGDLWHFNAIATCGGGKVSAYDYSSNENKTLYSTGFEGGHGGSGLSGIGGSVRMGELLGPDPIRHAIKLNVLASRYLVYNEDGTPGYRWPAVKADGYANPAWEATFGYGTSNPAKKSYMEMGVLLALKPDLTPQSLGITNPVVLKIFYALQNYGAYVVDDTHWNHYDFPFQLGVRDEVLAATGTDIATTDPNSQYFKDIMKILVNLNAITNNGPNSIGGGGTPRQPLAPPFIGTPTVSVTGITLSPATLSISIGASQSLAATIAPTDATNKNVTWLSSNTAVATVNSQGLVTAVGVGTATITATTVDGNKKATSTITVTTSSPCSNPITYKIMPIGDSKTEGGGLTGHQSWRGYLRAKIIQNSFSIDYVGNSNSETGGDPVPHDYDHEGHGGYTIGPDIQRWCPTCETTGIIEHIDSWLQPVSPDVIILSIGINDFFNEASHPANYQATAVQRYQDLVTKILTLKPNVKLVVCTIEPVKWDQNWGGNDGSDLAKLNDKIRQIANASTTDNIYLADLRADFLLTYSAADFNDDVHLTAQGATKTANTIYNTLKNIMPCGQGTTVPVTSISVTPTTGSISVGSSQAFTATINPTGATNKNVTWSSSNTAIATVNSQGLVTAVAVGTTTITATSVDGNKSASATITVSANTSTAAYTEDFTDNLAQGWQGSTNFSVANQVMCTNTTGGEEISFYNSQSFSNYTYKVKATPQWNNSFGVVFNYQDATNYYVLVLEVSTKNAFIKKMQGGTLTTVVTSTYTGGGAGVLYSIELTNSPTSTSVVVNGGGVFTNTPTIDFTSGKIGLYTFYNPVCFDDIQVNVQASQTAVTGVSITPTIASLTKGQTSQLTATVSPSTAANKAVVFISSNTAVATVSATGLVTAIAPGTSIITVTTQDGNKTATATITVTNINPVVTITSPTTNTSKCVGESISITATASDADGSISKVEFYEGATIIGSSTVAPYTTTISSLSLGTKMITAKAYDNLTGITTSTAVSVTVNALPTATITAGSATTFCQGGSVVLTSSAGTSYVWKNGTTQVGTSSTYTTAAVGSYTVEVTNAGGCKATSSATIVSVNSNPTASISTTTATTFCQGGSVVLTSSAGSSYKWLNGTTQVGTASMYTSTTAGSYTVEVTNASGCKAISSATIVSVNANPTASISTTTATTFCQGGSVVLTASAGSSYKWLNGTTQVGTASMYTATTAGSYTVEVTNASGCKSTSAATAVNINASTIWYADTDGDGKGDATQTLSACAKPTGYVAIAGDACPTDPNKIASGNCGCNKTEASCLDCAGVANGAAIIDACGKCAGGTTGIAIISDPNNCTSTNITGITGPLCVVTETANNYVLNTGSLSVSSISWWTNSGATIVKNAANPKQAQINFPTYTNGSSVTVKAGVNLNSAPWYTEYSLVVKVGGCSGSSPQLRAIATPIPFDSETTVSLENNETIVSIRIVDIKGTEVYHKNDINLNSFELGADLASGMYIAYISSNKGTSIVKLIKNN